MNPKLAGAVLHLQSYIYVVKGDVDLKVFFFCLHGLFLFLDLVETWSLDLVTALVFTVIL